MRFATLGRSGLYQVLLTLLFSLCFLPAGHADEGNPQTMPLESADDFARLANNSFPGIAQPAKKATAPEAGTGAPSGQTADPTPITDGITWQEYMDGLNELNQLVEKQTITELDWLERTQALRTRFLAGEKQRAQGFNRDSLIGSKPIDTRALQIEEGQIRVDNQGGENP